MRFTCEHCHKEIGCINVLHDKKMFHHACVEAYIESLGNMEVEEDIVIEEFGRCTLTHISNHEEQKNS
mgnify:CR=1 FL=1